MKTAQAADLDAFIRLTFKRYSLGASGRNSLRALINMTFKRAYFMGWIDENPASRIIWRDYDQFLKQSQPVENRAYTDKEPETLCNAARSPELQKEILKSVTTITTDHRIVTTASPPVFQT